MYRLLRFTVLISLMALSGCSDSHDDAINTPANLEDAAWKWTTFQLPGDEEKQITSLALFSVKFFNGDRIRGFATCNAFSGSYEVDSNVLMILALGVDGAVCDEDLLPEVQALPGFLGSLLATQSFEIIDGQLFLTLSDGALFIFDAGDDGIVPE